MCNVASRHVAQRRHLQSTCAPTKATVGLSSRRVTVNVIMGLMFIIKKWSPVLGQPLQNCSWKVFTSITSRFCKSQSGWTAQLRMNGPERDTKNQNPPYTYTVYALWKNGPNPDTIKKILSELFIRVYKYWLYIFSNWLVLQLSKLFFPPSHPRFSSVPHF